MALEPRTLSREDAPNPELADMKRRFVASAALTAPLFLLEMSSMLAPGLAAALSPRVQLLLQLVLATPVVPWGGWPFFQRRWTTVVTRRLDVFTLIAPGTGAAWLDSLARALPALFASRSGASGHLATHDVHFEAAAVIATLVHPGLAPKTVRRVTAGGADEDVPIERLKVGDRARVRPGEPVPVGRKPGDTVTGATVNGNGALGLATPMSVTVAMGRGARAGVFFEDAAALERLEKVDALVVDETGTRTEKSRGSSRSSRRRASPRGTSSFSPRASRGGASIPWPRPSWASRWGRGPRWRSRARESPSSEATSAASSARGA